MKLIALLLAFLAGDLSPLLDRRFPDTKISYLVIDASTREVREGRWPEADKPVPVGSLVKPFLALAYPGAYPLFDCKGKSSGCWLAHGHGRVNLSRALADSCNAYFLNLARGVNADALAETAAKFGIPPPSAQTPEARIGLGRDWMIPPIALMRAYLELASRRGDPRVGPILAGMALAAREGTASAIGDDALAKTGTAPGNDGYTLILAPRDSPRIVLMVRIHGQTGAGTAKTAARMLAAIRTGR